jgi:hypothetical protein
VGAKEKDLPRYAGADFVDGIDRFRLKWILDASSFTPELNHGGGFGTGEGHKKTGSEDSRSKGLNALRE